MIAKFSLAPPTKGDNNFNAVDILGVPSLEWIRKFSSGQAGIAQSCFDSFMKKTNVGLDEEISEIFTDLAKKNNETLSWGLPAMESTIIRSVFETQKPYIDAIMAVLDGLITLEDVIAVLKGGSNIASLKPKTNKKSLYTKMNSIKDDLEDIHGNAKPTHNSFSDFSFNQKMNGISLDDLLKGYDTKPKIVDENSFNNYDWVTVSSFYSTGKYVENIPYNYTYLDVTDVKPDLNVPPLELPEPINDDNPPTIIFDIWVDKLANNKFERITNPKLLPNDWDISTKWFGQWDGWTKTESGFINEYNTYINQLLDDEFDRNEITDKSLRAEIKEIFNNSLPENDELYGQYKAGNFKESIYHDINEDYANGSKKYDRITNHTLSKEQIGEYWHKEKEQFGYKPRKINGNWIDPEIDYHLRLIRVFPENSRTTPNNTIRMGNGDNSLKKENKSELSGSNPLVYSYGSDTLISEVMPNFDYLVDVNVPNNYTPKGYTISKTARAYPNSERSTDRDIIDKLRKGNTTVTEKVVIGDYNIRGTVIDILRDLENGYINKSLDNTLQQNFDKLLTLKAKDEVYIPTIVDDLTYNIIAIIRKKIKKPLFNEVGKSKIYSKISQSMNMLRNNMKTELGNGTTITKKFEDIIEQLGDISSMSTIHVGERVIVKEIGKLEERYGKYETKDIWGKVQTENNEAMNEIQKAVNKFNDSQGKNNKHSQRILNGESAENIEYIGGNPTVLRTPSRGDSLNETSFIDTGIFYIVEGVYKNRGDFMIDEVGASDSGVSGANAGTVRESYYKFGKSKVRSARSISAAIAKFAQFGASTLPSIITKTSQAMSVFKNPFNLIFEIIFEELSETFEAFNPEIPKKFAQLKKINGKEERRKFIQDDPTLRNFIALDSDFNYRFVFDGMGVMAIFGKNFGVGIKEIIPSIILEDNGLGAQYCSEVPPRRGKDNSGNYDNNGNKINNNKTNPNPLANVDTNNRLLDDTTYELVNIEYSTGDYKEGIDYQYYYITLDNQALVNKSNAYLEEANRITDKGEQIRLKFLAMEGYQKALVKDPDNIFLNKQLNDISKEDGVQINMIFQFLISIIFIPIKIVICIIEYIIDFFTNLKVRKIPTKIPEFLSFKWILDFFKPSKILSLLGMELNPELSSEWAVKALTADPTYKFDVSKIFSAPFLGKMPVYGTSEYPNIINGGPKMLLTMGGVFSFLEKIINEILCFLFNLFNLEKIFPCPKINLSKFTNETLSNEDINKLLENADYDFLNQTSDLGNDDSAFVYDVTLDNGEIIKDLNRSELQAFVASNTNLRYKYNFDEIT